MFRKTPIYRNFILPVLVDVIKILLWIFETTLPESIIDEAEDVLAQYYGKSNRLPDRIERLARKLDPENQDYLWEETQRLYKLQKNGVTMVHPGETRFAEGLNEARKLPM